MIFPGEIIEFPDLLGTYTENSITRASKVGATSEDFAKTKSQIVPKISNISCVGFKNHF